MSTILERVTVFCFAASYAVALALELLQLYRPRPIQRIVGLVFGAAGLLAHTIYILAQTLPVASGSGALLLVSWILAVFYLYGTLHHGKLAWGLFVLPLVLGMVTLAVVFHDPAWIAGDGSLLGAVHGTLLLLAAVGVCVGFVASVMYLVQVQRLRSKVAPTQGVRMLSLERIETMNRRAILLSFPFLTAGLLVGIILQFKYPSSFASWNSLKIVSIVGLWVVFAILLYLRYGVHIRGRQVAIWTMLAFFLMLIALVSAHPFVQGGGL